MDPRILNFLRTRGRLAPVGVGCVVVPGGPGRFLVQSPRPTGGVFKDGEYVGDAPFDVVRNPRGRDIVTLKPIDEIREAVLLPFWIPSIQTGIGFSFGGSPLEITLTASFNLLDVGLVPRSSGLRYPYDETTSFSVTTLITNAAPSTHTWTETAQADNSYHEDPSPWSFEWTDDNEITTIQVSVFAPGPVLLYRVSSQYQFALFGSDPISTTVEFQAANSAFS